MGSPYNRLVTASGGTAPYVFSLAFGTLPAGLSLSPAGPAAVRLSGTPIAAGVSGFVIQATDANGCFGALAYTITVSGPAPVPMLPGWTLLLLAGVLAAVALTRLRPA